MPQGNIITLGAERAGKSMLLARLDTTQNLQFSDAIFDQYYTSSYHNQGYSIICTNRNYSLYDFSAAQIDEGHAKEYLARASKFIIAIDLVDITSQALEKKLFKYIELLRSQKHQPIVIAITKMDNYEKAGADDTVSHLWDEITRRIDDYEAFNLQGVYITSAKSNHGIDILRKNLLTSKVREEKIIEESKRTRQNNCGYLCCLRGKSSFLLFSSIGTSVVASVIANHFTSLVISCMLGGAAGIAVGALILLGFYIRSQIKLNAQKHAAGIQSSLQEGQHTPAPAQ